MAMYNANLAGGGSSVTIDGVEYEEDLKLKSSTIDLYIGDLPFQFYYGSAVVLNGEIHILGSSNNSFYQYHYKWDR